MTGRGSAIALTALALSLLPLTACAPMSTRPAVAPSRDRLEAFLRSSPDAAAIAAAARAEGLLAQAESNIHDLEVVAAALGIERIADLGPRVAATVAESPLLFAALDERRRGSRTGDVAHWVAVALLSLDPGDAEQPLLRADIAWQPDYLDDVLALRRLYRQGRLAEAALPAPTQRQPQAYRAVVTPRLSMQQRPVVRAREQTGYWPVFGSPGSRAIAGTMPLQRGEIIEWEELRILVRRPGRARVLSPPQAPPPRFEISEDGTLTPAGDAALTEGEELDVLVQLPGTATVVRTTSGAVVELPWESGCCQLLHGSDADWWVRLADGAAAGTWILASADAFRISHPALEAVWQARRDNGPEPLRLGPLTRAGMVEVYGGARLSYWLRGTVDAPPLLVLHGGPGIGSHYLHEPLGETLGSSSLLYFYDQRGSGYSEGLDRTDLLTFDRAVLDLDRMRRAAELERVDIIAHSFGGLLALRYAIDYPQHVDRLVLVDPDPATRAEWETFRRRVAARTTTEDAARLREITSTPGWENDPRLVGASFSLRMHAYVSAPLPPGVRIGVPFNDATLPNWRTTPAIMRSSQGDWDLRDRLGRIRAPTLIVAGGDSVFPLAAMQTLADGIPGARLEVVENSGHFPFIEAAATFETVVSEFLHR